MAFIEILLGLVALVVGGQMLVNGSVSVAERLGVSKLLIGLTLVGFGTSTPELVTSLQAALADSPGIAIGNIVGSNTANILLILGLSAMIAPIAAAREAFMRDGTMVIAAALVCTAIVLVGMAGRVTGLLMIAALLAYLVYTYLRERSTDSPSAAVHAGEAEAIPVIRSPWISVLMAIVGLGLTIGGGHYLVSGAVDVARSSGLSETLIGLTLVAVGTSVPELVTSIIAALKRHGDVALGNILGSNIYNVLGILGITALVQPLEVPASLAVVDIWVMLGATLLMVAFAVTGWRLDRREGAVFVLAYAGYIAYLIASA